MIGTKRAGTFWQCPRCTPSPPGMLPDACEFGHLGIQDDLATSVSDRGNELSLMTQAGSFHDQPAGRQMACRMQIRQLPMGLTDPEIRRDGRRRGRGGLRERENLSSQGTPHTSVFQEYLFLKHRCVKRA
jgi:hypothetical protein